MMAEVEKPDRSYELVEMGDPVCGEDFCDGCGDCLACQYHVDVDWCISGSSRWVIYLDDPKNPYRAALDTEAVADPEDVGRGGTETPA